MAMFSSALKNHLSIFGCAAVFVAAHGLSLVAGSRGVSSQWLPLWSTGTLGLVAPRHVESSRSIVPCIGRQILYHWITRAVLSAVF